MAAFGRVKVDYRGVGEVLKGGPVASAVADRAASVASNLQPTASANGGEVVVNHEVTDRAVSSVILLARNAMALQAKYGIITAAAGAAGLEIGRKSRLK